MHQRSKGPSQEEFDAATKVQYLNSRPFARRHHPGWPQHAQQVQQAERAQQAQQAQDGSRQGAPDAGDRAQVLLQQQQQQQLQQQMQQQQQQQQQQGTLSSDRGQKRFAISEATEAQQPSKRGKHAHQV